jgi:flagella basal body P-ring formation protein FlgA
MAPWWFGATVSVIGVLAMPAWATEAPAAVRAAAEQAVRQRYALPGSRVEIKSAPLDIRLHLADCHLPLRATLPDNAAPESRMAVQVQCPQAGGWTVRVPLQLQLFRKVLVTDRALQRGDGLRSGDLRVEERDVTRLGYGYIENPDETAGRILARSLAAGSVLTPEALGGRRAVRAGDHVQLVARMDGIEVRAAGVALGGGDDGARLRVRNDSSGRVVDAMVSAPGEVTALP